MKTVSYRDPYDPLPVVIQIEDEDEEGIAEIMDLLNDDARVTQNLERKERYHTELHLDGLIYEGQQFATGVDIEADMIRQDQERRIYWWLKESLTPVQYRRFTQYMDGASIREIARRESADYSSVHESICAAQKKLQKICLDTPSEVPFDSPYSEE